MIRIKSARDFGAAMLCALLGAAGLWFGRGYETGTASAMGPGYMPMLLSLGLLGFAAVIGLRALTVESVAIGRVDARSALSILAAVLAFAALIRMAGSAPAIVAAFALAALGSRETRWREAAPLALGLAALCVAVFYYGLKQAMPPFGAR